MFNFWQSLSQESGLEIDYLQTHLFKRNDKGELSKKLGVPSHPLMDFFV
jgi:hypothetical protein